jgi:hypothetical protein
MFLRFYSLLTQKLTGFHAVAIGYQKKWFRKWGVLWETFLGLHRLGCKYVEVEQPILDFYPSAFLNEFCVQTKDLYRVPLTRIILSYNLSVSLHCLFTTAAPAWLVNDSFANFYCIGWHARHISPGKTDDIASLTTCSLQRRIGSIKKITTRLVWALSNRAMDKNPFFWNCHIKRLLRVCSAEVHPPARGALLLEWGEAKPPFSVVFRQICIKKFNVFTS